jgi:integrase
MSLYRRGKVWWMDFHFHGQRIQETTEMRSITRAREVQEKRKQALKDGAAGIRKQQQPRLLSVAAQEWQEAKQPAWSPRMADIAKNSTNHLLPVLGKKLLVDIEASDISKYQKARLADGASNRTVNIEVGVLRQIMKKYGTWARVQPDVNMLPEREDAGRALSEEEESALLLECGRSRSRILLPFVLLALETGARFNTIRTLQWKNINFGNRCLQFGRDKTSAGTGRVVPLNQRALGALTFWAQQFPNRSPEHYVFALEKSTGAGTKGSFGFTGSLVYDTDPTQPIGDVKEAWEGAKRRTRRHCPNCTTGILAEKEKPETGYGCVECRFETRELPAGLVPVRFHDLRHSAVSRMITARVPLPIIAKIVGWAPGTMAKMAARYGHFGIEELRGAVEAISSNVADRTVFRTGSLQFSLHSEANSGDHRAN